MAFIPKILQCLAVLLASVLLAGAYDVGHLGLKEMLAGYSVIPIALFAIFSIVPIFLTSGKFTEIAADDEDEDERIGELQAKMNSRLTALQTKIDGFSGPDREALEEENHQLREQLEAVHQAEREKVANDAELLRARNEELENQIRQWAIEAVGDNIAGEKSEQSQAA